MTDLRQATEELEAVKKRLEAARKIRDLAIVAASREGVPRAVVADIAGVSLESVRRICRDHGFLDDGRYKMPANMRNDPERKET